MGRSGGGVVSCQVSDGRDHVWGRCVGGGMVETGFWEGPGR